MRSYREIIDIQRRYSDLPRGDEALQNNPDVTSNSAASDSQSAQTHTHEFSASTKLAETGTDRHNHRFAGVTSQVIPLPCNNHSHTIFTLTDYFGHLHEVAIETSPAISVGDGKHVHFVSGITTLNDGHTHEFAFATMIQSPLLP